MVSLRLLMAIFLIQHVYSNRLEPTIQPTTRNTDNFEAPTVRSGDNSPLTSDLLIPSPVESTEMNAPVSMAPWTDQNEYNAPTSMKPFLETNLDTIGGAVNIEKEIQADNRVAINSASYIFYTFIVFLSAIFLVYFIKKYFGGGIDPPYHPITHFNSSNMSMMRLGDSRNNNNGSNASGNSIGLKSRYEPLPDTDPEEFFSNKNIEMATMRT